MSITDNRSTKDGSSVHIEADIVVDSGKSGVLFSVPASVAPKTPISDLVSFGTIGTVISRAGNRYPVDVTLGTDGSASIESSITTSEDVEGTVTFDYTLQ